MISTLPVAIAKLPDMLYPRCAITIEGNLGNGQFGSVFKGLLKMGKAR